MTISNMLREDIRRTLIDKFGFRQENKYLRKGLCPDCNEKQLYTSAEIPWWVRCNRINDCGYEASVKELLPEIFESWSDRYKTTEDSPTAAADAYLSEGRGFNLARLAGSYTQEWYRDFGTKETTATVRFALPGGTYWERLIDRPQRFGKNKARFAAGESYAGQAWVPPTVTAEKLLDAEEIWFAEGIFDASALDHHQVIAAATLSTTNYPAKFLARVAQARLEAGKPAATFVWAFDGDRAGRKAIRAFVERARGEGHKCDAATIAQGKVKRDWSDLHLADALTPKHLERYRYEGSLLIARTPAEKARLIYNRTGMGSFFYEFDACMYWFELDNKAFDKALVQVTEKDPDMPEAERRALALEEAAGNSEIANCYPNPLYYLANATTDEAWYYYRISQPGKGFDSIKSTFVGGALASASEFKKRLLSVVPGAVFTGTSQQLDRIIKVQLKGIKTVETIDFIGYAKEHKAYIMGEVAIKAGAAYDLNDEDYFELGRTSVKTLTHSPKLVLSRDMHAYQADWMELVWRCFGAKGLVALTFWFGSFFAEQIRAIHKSYPFLELVGEAGAGKSTLIEFMWKLVGRTDYEGFDPSKATLAARSRNFAQVANLPVVLIESDREGDDAKKRFDWDELKTAYNGRSVRAIGVKNAGNDTREPPFRSTVVISQNAKVEASEAIMQRIVHVTFDRSAHTAETRVAALKLEQMPVDGVSQFFVLATRAEAKVMAIIEEAAPRHEAALIQHPDVKTTRIAKNHGQLLAIFDAMCEVLPMRDEQRAQVHAEIVSMAVERQQSISADHKVVQAFWERFDYLDTYNAAEPVLNHSRRANEIAVSLNHFEQRAAEHRLQVPTNADLKKYLRSSKSRKFIDYKDVCSGIWTRTDETGEERPRTVKCFVFHRGHGEAPDARIHQRGSGE